MKKMMSVLGATVLLLGLALLTVVHATPRTAVPTPSAAAGATALPSADPAPVPQEHPEIREALEACRRARAHIHDAAHDFGGHRVDALRDLDAAIHQLEICMRYDR
jgi:hypothetical protein